MVTVICLSLVQTNCKKKWRFSVIVDEVCGADDVVYKTTLLEFINCLIIYAETTEERIRIRNELFGEYWRSCDQGRV